MLRRVILLFFLILSVATAAERKYLLPLAPLKPENVKELRITSIDSLGKARKTQTIADQQVIHDLLKLATPKDYPVLGKHGLGMSMPGTLIKADFIGKDGRPSATIEVLGAWNLMYAKGPGVEKIVTGSNRALCEKLMKRLETLHPEVHAEATQRYRDQISGTYPEELHEVLSKEDR